MHGVQAWLSLTHLRHTARRSWSRCDCCIFPHHKARILPPRRDPRQFRAHIENRFWNLCPRQKCLQHSHDNRIGQSGCCSDRENIPHILSHSSRLQWMSQPDKFCRKMHPANHCTCPPGSLSSSTDQSGSCTRLPSTDRTSCWQGFGHAYQRRSLDTQRRPSHR